MDQPNATKSPRGSAQATDVGKHQLRGVADDHRLDLAGTVHEHAHLARRRVRCVDEVTSEFRGGDAIGRDAPAIETLEGLDVAGREASGVAEDLQGRFLRWLRRSMAHRVSIGRALAVIGG
jgi:hypothetical protein